MPDEHGEIAYSCDCTKKQAFTFTCIHIQFVEQYPMEFGNALFEGEEPTSFLIRQERKTWMFSIASQSGSSRHHSHKRVIVTLTGYDEWKCPSCVKKRYLSIPYPGAYFGRDCKHIAAAMDEYRLLFGSPDMNPFNPGMISARAAARSVSSARAVSHFQIPPPQWCRLPQEKHLPTVAFQGGRKLPALFNLDSNSQCSCGEIPQFREDVTVSNFFIYTSFMVITAEIETCYCPSCQNTRGRVGPDLREHGIFNWNNRFAFSHELMNSYTSHFTTSETPFYAFYQTIVNAYLCENSVISFCSERIFLCAWFAFVRLQTISSDMQCSQCGPNPAVVIADGISVSFPKQHRLAALQPPTVSDKSKAYVKLLRKPAKATCFVGPQKLRKRVLNALEEEDRSVGWDKLYDITQELVGP